MTDQEMNQIADQLQAAGNYVHAAQRHLEQDPTDSARAVALLQVAHQALRRGFKSFRALKREIHAAAASAQETPAKQAGTTAAKRRRKTTRAAAW